MNVKLLGSTLLISPLLLAACNSEETQKENKTEIAAKKVEKDQLGIIYEVKNKSDKEIDAISGWLAVFEATQDTKDTVHKLNVGGLLNLEKYTPFLDTQLDTIKKMVH